MRAALTANVNCLVDAKLLAPHQVQAILYLFGDDNELLDRKQAVLVHNDIADWNVLTDGQSITALLDWDECVASHPTADIACWSLFFDTERLEPFLDGYWQVAPKSSDFGDMLALMRFRYALSKMALRVKRFSYDPSDFVKERIVSGNVHLTASLKHFAIA